MDTTTNQTIADSPLTIVLARAESDFELVRERRTDLGERPVVREVKVATACVWLLRGTRADVPRAEAYARTEGYTVFTFATGVRDPLAKARAAVLAATG